MANYWKVDCNKKCCGTCKYYTGKREVSKGFYGDEVNVEVENAGFCSRQWNNPEKKEYDSCFSYERAEDIQIAEKELKLKQFKREQETKKIDNEKRLKRLQSDSDAIMVDKNTSISTSSKANNGKFLFGGVGLLFIILVIALVGIFVPKDNSPQLTGENKVVADYIKEKGVRDNKYNEYYITKNVTIENISYEIEIRYFNKTKDNIFATYVRKYAQTGDDYKYYTGILYFNCNERSSLDVSAIASYESGTFFIYFNEQFGTYPNISYSGIPQVSNFNGMTITDKMKDDSITNTWDNIKICISQTNEFLQTINYSYKLW